MDSKILELNLQIINLKKQKKLILLKEPSDKIKKIKSYNNKIKWIKLDISEHKRLSRFLGKLHLKDIEWENYTVFASMCNDVFFHLKKIKRHIFTQLNN